MVEQHTTAQTIALPPAGSPVAVRLICCAVDRPTRVASIDGSVIVLSRPYHPCRSVASGEHVSIVWSVDGQMVGTVGELREVPGRTPRWHVRVTDAVAPAERRGDPRFPVYALAIIRTEAGMIPAHVVDRSRTGLGCRTGGAARIERNAVVTVEIGDEVVRARVVRARPAGSSLDVGLRVLGEPD